MAFYPLKARTHLKYAQGLMAEAMRAEQLGHRAEVGRKCRDISEHALKAIFNIAGIDIEKYRDLEDAVSRGLKKVFDRSTVGRLRDNYSTLKLKDPEELDPAKCIEKASFILKTAIELIREH